MKVVFFNPFTGKWLDFSNPVEEMNATEAKEIPFILNAIAKKLSDN